MSGRETSTEMEEFKSDLYWNMKTLEKNIELLGSREDKRFAKSLCDWYAKYANLSDKQMYRACHFWQEVNSLGAADANPESRGSVVSIEGKAFKPAAQKRIEPALPVVRADGSKLLAHFDKAAETLKYPHLVYWLGVDEQHIEGEKLKFYRTGFQSKKPGTVMITNGFPWPEGKIFAQIMRDGTVSFSQLIWDQPEFQQFLKRIIEDPVEQFKINGQKYKHCCFCGLELTDPRSLQAGYGPICASKWDLPWGDEPSPDELLAQI